MLPQPDNDVTTGVLRLWGAVNLDARFLNVVDVSSAMGSRTGNGETRAEVTRDAANLGLTYFPDTTEVGLWTFADQLRTTWSF